MSAIGWKGKGLSYLCLVMITWLASIAVRTSRSPASSSSHPDQCPKVLMFGGLDIHTQIDETMARYWGQKIGIDGFFVYNLMGNWDDLFAGEDGGPVYQRLKQFQNLYSQYGVTDNFLEVGLSKVHDWVKPDSQTRVILNFRQAARLAKFAGLKGLALDIEPYVPGYW